VAWTRFRRPRKNDDEKNNMKWDKETVLVIAFCVVFTFAWGPISKKLWPPRQPAPAGKNVDEASKNGGEANPPTAGEKNTPAPTAPPPAETAPQKEKPAEKEQGAILSDAALGEIPPSTIENDYIKATIDWNKGIVSSVELKKFLDADKKKNVEMLRHADGGALGVFPAKGSWTLLSVKTNAGQPGADPAPTLRREFRDDSGRRFAITQKWSVKDHYVVGCDVEIENLSQDKPLALGGILIGAGGMTPIKNMAGDKVLRETFDLDYFDVEKGKVISETATRSAGFFSKIFGAKDPDKNFVEKKEVKAKWVGSANRYFASILVPDKPFDAGIVLAGTQKGTGKKTFVVASAKGIATLGEILPSGTKKISLRYFAGPKDIHELNKLDPDASKIMKLYFLGMIFLEPLSLLLLKVLLYLKTWCGSYGLSIVLLTFIVKTIFWPVTHKANVSMRKMQKIQPLVQELKKKYKDEPQRVSLETMKLYKEHKVNPLGGCLPILLQMPVFFALYAMLSGTVDPRQSSFLWMSDLAQPDTIFTIPFPGFPIPIRPLMLMMTATMFMQQKLTPSTADPAQQKMMMMMPFIMLVMLYSLPSGLTLYWTVSQFISISQLIVNQQLEKRAALKEEGAA